MDGLELLSLSILVGSLFWGWFVLRVSRPRTATPESAWRRCMRVLRAGALALAVTQALKILTEATVLSFALGELPLRVYAGTAQFQAGGIRIVLAAALLWAALGALETRARAGRPISGRLPAVFPVLCAFGGVLLVTHAHTAFEIKGQYLIQSTHLVMGLLAIIMATGRWLELRLAATGDAVEAKPCGLAAVCAMLMIGAILAIYREPLV